MVEESTDMPLYPLERQLEKVHNNVGSISHYDAWQEISDNRVGASNIPSHPHHNVPHDVFYWQ